MAEAEDWMDGIGSENCSLCELAGKIKGTNQLNCQECLLNDPSYACCKEYCAVSKATYPLNNEPTVEKFNAACEALQTRIRSLKVG